MRESHVHSKVWREKFLSRKRKWPVHLCVPNPLPAIIPPRSNPYLFLLHFFIPFHLASSFASRSTLVRHLRVKKDPFPPQSFREEIRGTSSFFRACTNNTIIVIVEGRRGMCQHWSWKSRRIHSFAWKLNWMSIIVGLNERFEDPC